MSIDSLLVVFKCSFISNAPFGFVFHFALMQNETKDQDCAFCLTRLGLES